MARTIQSPGVQIQEIDLSLRAVGSPATTVFIPGFAPRGPLSEPIKVSSLSEHEQIFGQPTNAAERYFYHSVKSVFNSPSDVLVYRLPYGSAGGIDTSANYSALVYPVVSFVNGASSTALDAASGAYFFGKPTHLKLNTTQYLDLIRGNGFTWSNNTSGSSTFNTVASLSAAGMIVLNKSQSTINSRYEGYYFGAIDNTNLNPSTPFNGVNSVLSINTTAVAISNYVTIPDVRLNFALSAAAGGASGSVSEVVENIPTFDTSSNQFDDTATFGVFKLRQSVFSPDTIALDYVLEESYNASFDTFRQINSPNGGPAISFFMETVDNSSTQITTLINPYISNKNTSTWLDLSGIPTKKVRFLSTPMQFPVNNEDAATYATRIGAPSATYAGFINRIGATDALIALGDFSQQDINTKIIGNLPAKLQNAFARLDNTDLYPINITVEAGLGTIYANSFNPATSGYFDDSVPYPTATASLTAQNPTSVPAVVSNYLAVANEFVSLAESKRKDHIFIADPLTNIFVENNIKTLDNPANTFSNNIYWPLRNQFNAIDSNYVCTFANCAKVADIATNQQVWVPFSGFAATAMANTDSNFQPWYAPAGFTRGIITGVTDIGFYPKQKERDQIYKISLNPIAFFPAEGFVIFGQKTLQKKPSAFDRINVRRLFLNLETATQETVKYFVFEPNTLFTRTQVLNTLTPLFENAKNTQGVYDFLIICDERNNPTSVVDDNSLVVDIYLKPVRTAEFILCNFYATRTGTNFQEIVA